MHEAVAGLGLASLTTRDVFGNAIPDHVPQNLVRTIDWWHGPGMDEDPFAVVRALREGPALVYNTHNPLKGQSWLPTRAAEIRFILTNPAIFSSRKQADFSGVIGEDWRLIPVELDPPEHGQFRKIVESRFSPRSVAGMGDEVRARAVELIDALASHGECEFKEDFATPFPVSIFMEVMGFPIEDMPTLLIWARQIMQGSNEMKVAGMRGAVEYVRRITSERRAEPAGDLITSIVEAEVDGRPISEEDALGTCVLLFIGGLDTVVGSLGLAFAHLAANPGYQARLRESPDLIPAAVEEYLRVFSPAQSQRCATQDIELAGVHIRRGDWITIVDAFASLDPKEFPNPDVIDPGREGIRHMAFSTGPHLCLGRHLARREIAVAIQEWLTRVPPFRIAAGERAELHGGNTFGVKRLPITWTSQPR